MPLRPNSLEVAFSSCSLGLSARRCYEHIAHYQLNPFKRSIGAIRTTADAASLIDVYRIDSLGEARFTGFTLADLERKECRATLSKQGHPQSETIVAAAASQQLVKDVLSFVQLHTMRRASRNVPIPFLPPPEAGDALGVPRLRSRLYEYLTAKRRVRASAEQWLGTISNLAAHGLREEERQRSNLIDFLIDQL
ncbi:MAG: hypothetical protein ACKO15_08210, partial [Burkholderiales bacterium]